MMDPEDFMLSKVRQMEKYKYHMISLHVEYKKQTSNTKKMNKSNQKVDSVNRVAVSKQEEVKVKG